MRFGMHVSIAAIVTILAAPGALPGAEEHLSMEDMLRTGRNWVEQNLDLEQPAVDHARIRAFWRRIQHHFEGEYVIELARIRDEAQAMLAILEHIDSAAPYASWLRTRLDYFEVAEELRVKIEAPQPSGNIRTVAPPPELQRRVWREQIADSNPSVGSQHYVDRLKPIFSAGGVPSELVWLAEVESSFNPNARSPVGALGLFQFMPATAKQYGLSLTPVDQRVDPEKSARAAAAYLRHLHKRFSSWPLALAAYNAGEGRVSRLLRTSSGGGDFDSISARLPSETQLYVPKVEATIYKRENVDIRAL